MMETTTKIFTSVQQTHPLQKGTETMKRTLNMESMRIAQNWLNISGIEMQ